jgi:hypothetical protein
MWQHRLPDGSIDCPAWRDGTKNEPADARAKREEAARKAAAPPPACAPSRIPTPQWRIAERLEEYFDEKSMGAIEDEDSGDRRARRVARAPARW